MGRAASFGREQETAVDSPGLAHGFVVLSETAEFLYKTTDYYAPAHERCIAWNDPKIGIEWPLTAEPLLSGKDKAGVRLEDALLPAR